MSHQPQGGVTFGPWLKAHREAHGITLEALSASTKIKASVLADLEQNRIDRWPEGIYRRAWLREYAVAIGMSPETVLEEFACLFPEASKTTTARGAAASALRLTFTDAHRRRPMVTRQRAIDAFSIFLVVLAAGAVLNALTGLSFWTASGAVALIWYPFASAVYGGASLRGLLRVPIAPTAPLMSQTFVAAARSAWGNHWLTSGIASCRRWLAILGHRVRSFVTIVRTGSLRSRLAASHSANDDVARSTNRRQRLGRWFFRMGSAFPSRHLRSSLPRFLPRRGLQALPRLLARSRRGGGRHARLRRQAERE